MILFVIFSKVTPQSGEEEHFCSCLMRCIRVKSADNAKLSPNQILNICMQSLSRDIQIVSVDSMVRCEVSFIIYKDFLSSPLLNPKSSFISFLVKKIVGKNTCGEDEDLNVITVEGGIAYDVITTKNIVNECFRGPSFPLQSLSTLSHLNLLEPTLLLAMM